ncbi:hypothetical protein F5X96DRAFT_150151 [Biscogniauxia mediterranea]|nr:hypothetical protein F5X96DRAFT_150151 [Biscogniauxia mediterranea]
MMSPLWGVHVRHLFFSFFSFGSSFSFSLNNSPIESTQSRPAAGPDVGDVSLVVIQSSTGRPYQDRPKTFRGSLAYILALVVEKREVGSEICTGQAGACLSSLVTSNSTVTVCLSVCLSTHVTSRKTDEQHMYYLECVRSHEDPD